MALEEVGTRLVAEGEAQFTSAMSRADKAVKGFGITTTETDKKVSKSTGGLKQFNDAFKSVTGVSLTTAGAVMAAGVAFNKLVDYGKEAIKAASDMNETLSKSSVVFGKYSKDIEAMGETAATSMGLSKQEAIAAAATYGNLFTSMDMGKDVSANMSKNLVQLASDLASFNNIPVAEALEKIRAGLVGESEPLKSLGININETALKQEALNLGLKVGTGALGAAEKAQAAYSLMLKQSSNAQGDFARTADGAANQQRILEAQMKDLKAEIGEGLLPVWVELLGVMNTAVQTFNLLRTREQSIDDVVRQHEQDMRKSAKTYNEYITEMKRALAVSKGFKNWTEYTRYMRGHNLTIEDVYRSYGILNEETGKLWISEGNLIDTVAEGNPVISTAARNYEAMGKAAAASATSTHLEGDEADYLATKMKPALEHVGNFLDAQGNAIAQGIYDKAAAGMQAQADAAKNLAAQTDIVTQSLEPMTEALFRQKVMGLLAGDALLEYARANGLLDERTYNTIKTLDELKKQFDLNRDGVIDATEATDEFKRSIDALTSKTIFIDTIFRDTHIVSHEEKPTTPATKEHYEGQPVGPGSHDYWHWNGHAWVIILKRAAGGPVRAGKPVLVGERGPEPFIPSQPGYILSHSDAMRIFAAQVAAPAASVSAGPSIYNNTSNYSPAYNLNVMTSQSPAVVQRSFAMMKLLAG